MNKEKVGFFLRKIVTEQFSTFEDVEDIEDEASEIKLKTGIEYGINEVNKVVACYTKFHFILGKAPFITIEVKCEFEILKTTWNKYIDKKKRTINFPEGFLKHLAIITVGTTRGVLHAKTEHTSFNKFFLPTVNVNALVKGDMALELD